MQIKDLTLFRQQAYVNGQWVDADSGEKDAVYNPANGIGLGYVPRMAEPETEQAIEAANTALTGWRSKTANERAALLRKWYELMLEHQEDLALIMTEEQGKPLKEAKGEIAYAASFLEWFAEEGKRAYGATIPADQADKRIMVLKQPVGVSAAITPWNFPSAMITRKAAAALAAGCTIVVKPASATPFSALALAELADRAGIPRGVFNVVTGNSGAIGKTLCESAVVRKLSFTGSTEVGAKLMAQCAPNIKKLSLELGGNAPFIVFEDADVDAAVEGAIAAKYRNAGQTCVCANRIYVQSGIYDVFAEKLAASVEKLNVGSGLGEDVVIGPLINEQAVEKVEQQIADAVKKGGEVMAGGQRHQLGGSFFEPTVIKHASSDMLCAKEETFGPMAPLFNFTSVNEAVSLANDTEFGLAAYFFSRDVSKVWQVAERLEYGMVGVNTGLISTAVAPFGGVKSSGLGREGSKWGLDEYMELKYICLSV